MSSGTREDTAARFVSALSDGSRIRILSVLLDTPATTSELVARLSLDQPRVSTHLAILKNSGLVSVAVKGRQHVYSIKSKEAAEAIRVLMRLADISIRGKSADTGRSKAVEKEVSHDSPIRRARTCYDHLAGVAGVKLLDELKNRGWLKQRRLKVCGRSKTFFALTELGEKSLSQTGLRLSKSRNSKRLSAYGCLDWTERRDHLGGELGKMLLEELIKRRMVERASGNKGSRVVKVLKPISFWPGS